MKNFQCDIELKEGATPYHGKAYPVPKAIEHLLREEVERLCNLKVLRKINISEWGFPSFAIPKKK